MLIRRIIEGKRNNKNRKKRNTKTTDFEPLHSIALITSLTFFSAMHIHSLISIYRCLSLDVDVLWNVSFHVTIMVISVCFSLL